MKCDFIAAPNQAEVSSKHSREQLSHYDSTASMQLLLAERLFPSLMIPKDLNIT
jgi:hypothetical protein